MVTRLTLLLVALVAACATARPKIALDLETTIPGAAIEIRGSWSATCRVSDGGSWKHEDYYDADCEHVPVRVHVDCEHCEVEEPDAGAVVKTFRVRVVPLQLGPLHLRITQWRSDTDERHVEERVVSVVRPTFGHSCGPRGDRCEVAADSPVVWVWTTNGRRAVQSRWFRINGQSYPVANHADLSLAELFPAARRDGGLAPGTYRIELSVDDGVQRFGAERFDVVVRPAPER